ncbi:MAG: SpoIIE family protein phosphatase [Lachnospiraceae bacterium]
MGQKVKRNVVWFVVSGLIFFAVTMPFRKYFALMEVTEIRPAAALPPFFGMVYGFWGALGCATANFIADLLSGYSLWMSVCSFPIQFLMGILPYLLWYHIPVLGEEKPSFPKMDTTAHVVKYMLIMIANSVLITLLLGIVMKLFGIADVFSQATLVMFWNNLDFSYMLGLPLFALIALKKKQHFSLNERLILIFLLLAILAAILTGTSSWREATAVSNERMYLWNRVYTDVAVTLNVFMFVEILFLFYMEKRITIPIENLADLAKEYVKLDEEKLNTKQFIDACKLYENDQTEVGKLARSYAQMVTDLNTYMTHLTQITAEKERIGTELALATKIQADMLPCIFPAFPERKEFTVYATMNPAKEVGGDFYDFFMVDDRHLAVVMADVSGKGVPAALFMVIGKTLIKDHTRAEESLGLVFSDVNNLLCDANSEGLFITAFEGVLDLVTGEFCYVNAGHEVPYICKKGETFEPYKVKPGFVLAGMEDMKYKAGSVQFEVGDKIFLYTDGVPEATNAANELYGSERLYQVLNQNREKTPEELLPAVKNDVDKFVGDAPQFDDLTMLCLEYKEQMKLDAEVE